MLTLVRIKGTAITAQYGTLTDGTLLRTSAEFARHLVEDARAAEYVANTQAEPEPQAEPQTTPAVRQRKSK